MRKEIYILLFSFFIILMNACKEDDFANELDNDSVENTQFDLGNTITASFFGRILDAEGNPVSGAKVTIGNITKITDPNGIYSLRNVSTHERIASISVEKATYYKVVKSVVKPSQSTINQLDIYLHKKTLTETIVAGQTSEVEVGNACTVTFDGSFVDSYGRPYNGNIQVYTQLAHPDDEGFISKMPGALYGFTQDNREALLMSHGMVNVLLESPSGEKLQLAENHPATIKMKIANNLQSQSSDEIPMWHFNENAGVWAENGKAVKVGQEYIAKVSHFSWWNFDYFSTNLVNVIIHVKDQFNYPIANKSFPIYLYNSGLFVSTAYTNSQGVISGYVPANSTLMLNYGGNFTSYGVNCSGEPITYTITQQVDIEIGNGGTFNAQLTIDSVNNPNEFLQTTITGNFNNCNGEPIQNGYVEISNSDIIIPIENGTISYVLQGSECQQGMSLNYRVVDLAANTISNELSANIILSQPSNNLGTQSACGYSFNLSAANELLIVAYNKLHDYGGAHDEAGQKSKDLGTDLMTEDMVHILHHWFGFYYLLDNRLANYRATNHFWNEVYYPIINHCNEVLLSLNLNSTDAYERSLIGQAKALRAFAYLQLCELYQKSYTVNPQLPGVPIYALEQNINLPSRNTLQQVYDLMISDLNSSIAYLQGSNLSKEKINTNVAHGILARVFLTMENWQLALYHAQMAKQGYALMNNTEYRTGFSNLFLNEMMWGKDINSENTNSYGSYFSHISNLDYGYAGLLQSYKLMDYRLYTNIPMADARKELFNGPLAGLPACANLKFFTSLPDFSGDMIYMRASEMFLIEAEAQAKLGNIPAANEALQQLLVSTGRNTTFSYISNNNDLLNEIYLQRRIELWGEGFALNDIKRRNLGIDRNYAGTNHRNDAIFTFSAQHPYFVFQLPTSEINNNPFISESDQNP